MRYQRYERLSHGNAQRMWGPRDPSKLPSSTAQCHCIDRQTLAQRLERITDKRLSPHGLRARISRAYTLCGVLLHAFEFYGCGDSEMQKNPRIQKDNHSQSNSTFPQGGERKYNTSSTGREETRMSI